MTEITLSQPNGPIAVLGATGYIGARLVPRLVDAGWTVRAIGRNRDKLQGRRWSHLPGVETAYGDVFDLDSLIEALQGCQAAFYLVHSMNPNVKNFAKADRLAAQNMVSASSSAGVRRILYLAGLGDESTGLSHHLQSRREVENILKQGTVPATVFRAAMIIGSGSASFEILRYLVERLPVM
ncbi:MAG: NAD(P)H-binding protein, partial [Deltaproteobacteria bacterium]|nr:NAD(P)H-binding protein [Deltaproteobacteria bacterium]